MAFALRCLLLVGLFIVAASASTARFFGGQVASANSAFGSSAAGTTGLAHGVGHGLFGGANAASHFGGTGSASSGLGNAYGSNGYGRGSSAGSYYGGAGTASSGRGKATGAVGGYPGYLSYGDVSGIYGSGFPFPGYEGGEEYEYY